LNIPYLVYGTEIIIKGYNFFLNSVSGLDTARKDMEEKLHNNSLATSGSGSWGHLSSPRKYTLGFRDLYIHLQILRGQFISVKINFIVNQ